MNLYKNTNLMIQLSEKLEETRRNGKFCDFTIKSNDGKQLPVHKIILISVSKFFEKMFDSGMRETRQDSLTLDGISGENLECIIEYMYTGNIKICFENAREILDTALFLGFNDVVEFCTKILINEIKEGNIWDLFKYSKTLIADDLMEACLNWMLINIEVISESLELKDMSIDDIRKLLTRKNDQDDLSEDKFHWMIMKWVKNDIENRRIYTKELIEFLNFDLMTKKYLQSDEIFETANLVDDRDFIVSFLQKTQKIIESKNEKLPSSSSNQTLYVVTSRNIHKLYPNSEQLDFLINHYDLSMRNNKLNIRSNFACAGFGKGDFFICSGDEGYYSHGYIFDSLVWARKSTCYCKIYSYEKQTWIDIPFSMEIHNPRAVHLDDQIFLYNNSNVMNILDLSTCLWFSIRLLHSFATIDSLCTLNKCLYLSSESSIYLFDRRSTLCKPVTTTNCGKSEIIGYDSYIYQFTSKGYCIFDTRNNKWFNDFHAYEKDLEKERQGLVKTFLDTSNTCVFNLQKREWMIRLKPYSVSGISFESSEIPPRACLCNDEIFLYHKENVQIYKASNLNFIKEFKIAYPKDEYCVEHLISF